MRNALWTVRLRWLGGTTIIVGALLARFVGVIDQAGVLIAIGLAVMGYNSLISIAMGSSETRLTFERAQRLWLVQIVADVSSMTAIIYFCGGIESPIIIFYVFHVVCAGILLPRRLSYLVATLATVLVGLVGVSQAAVPSLYHPLALDFEGQYYRNWSFVGLEVLAFGAAMHVAVHTTAAIRKRLRATERQIIHARNLLNSIITSMSEVVIFLSPKGELEDRYRFDGVVGTSPALREVLGLAHKLSQTNTGALISGETGTGKELVARAMNIGLSSLYRKIDELGISRVAESSDNPADIQAEQ